MANITILVLGAKGMLGTEIVKYLKQANFKVVESDYVLDKVDISKRDQVEELISIQKPSFVINCAAIVDVDGCEDDEMFEKARKVNGIAPGKISEICKKEGVNFVHFSTDYVFSDDLKEGYEEAYMPRKPMNKYGEVKAMGEENIENVVDGQERSHFKLQKPKTYIIRTQWIYGPGTPKFVHKITEMARKLPELNVVDDEFGCPTYIKDVAKDVLYLINEKPRAGIYHSVSSNHCSRYEFARRILELQKIKTPIKRSKLKDFSRKARISNYSILKNTKLPQHRTWEDMLEDFLENNKI